MYNHKINSMCYLKDFLCFLAKIATKLMQFSCDRSCYLTQILAFKYCILPFYVLNYANISILESDVQSGFGFENTIVPKMQTTTFHNIDLSLRYLNLNLFTRTPNRSVVFLYEIFCTKYMYNMCQ